MCLRIQDSLQLVPFNFKPIHFFHDRHSSEFIFRSSEQPSSSLPWDLYFSLSNLFYIKRRISNETQLIHLTKFPYQFVNYGLKHLWLIEGIALREYSQHSTLSNWRLKLVLKYTHLTHVSVAIFVAMSIFQIYFSFFISSSIVTVVWCVRAWPWLNCSGKSRLIMRSSRMQSRHTENFTIITFSVWFIAGQFPRGEFSLALGGKASVRFCIAFQFTFEILSYNVLIVLVISFLSSHDSFWRLLQIFIYIERFYS